MTDQRSRRDTAAAAPLRAGVVTGVGSLPHAEVGEAIDFVLTHTSELPALPTLPRRDGRELMLAQAAWGIPGVSVADDGTITVTRSLDPAAPLGDPELSGPPFATWRAFLSALSGRTGPLKLQVTGPVTLALALLDAGVAASLALAVAGSAVGQRVEALVALARRHRPEAPLVLVLDEPALVRGFRADGPLSPDDQIDVLSSALAEIEHRAAAGGAGAVAGIHCCGPSDWRALLQAGPQLISAPVGAGLPAAAGAVAQFLDGGGWIAWGAVPTAAPLGERSDRFWKLLSSQWCDLVQAGCDPVRLRQQALVTPECGLALHDEGQAAHVFDLCRDVAEHLHHQALGLRLSVGA